MFKNLFKVRSPFGKFLDKLNRDHNITQENFSQISKVNRNTISRCANSSARPSRDNARKIIKACKKFDGDVEMGDFWYYTD